AVPLDPGPAEFLPGRRVPELDDPAEVLGGVGPAAGRGRLGVLAPGGQHPPVAGQGDAGGLVLEDVDLDPLLVLLDVPDEGGDRLVLLLVVLDAAEGHG